MSVIAPTLAELPRGLFLLARPSMNEKGAEKLKC